MRCLSIDGAKRLVTPAAFSSAGLLLAGTAPLSCLCPLAEEKQGQKGNVDLRSPAFHHHYSIIISPLAGGSPNGLSDCALLRSCGLWMRKFFSSSLSMVLHLDSLSISSRSCSKGPTGHRSSRGGAKPEVACFVCLDTRVWRKACPGTATMALHSELSSENFG